jgi:hypothetical protein
MFAKKDHFPLFSILHKRAVKVKISREYKNGLHFSMEGVGWIKVKLTHSTLNINLNPLVLVCISFCTDHSLEAITN